MPLSTRVSSEQRPQLFAPIQARSQTAHSAIDPVAYDCLQIIVVRAGGAVLFSEGGVHHVNVGDVAVLGANTLCGAEPEDSVTSTVIYLDRDYVIDQVFWQYAANFSDRLDAEGVLDDFYAEPAQIVRIGEDRAGMLMPWLDELAALSIDGLPPERFYRAQSLLFAVLDVIVPFLSATKQRTSPTQRSATIPAAPRHRRFEPLRSEALQVADLLRNDLARRWAIADLADAVHLSPSQLGRVFTEALGKSPIAYLAMLRTERMAFLLRTTDKSIATIAAETGWSDPDFAARQFRRGIGVSPSEYRNMNSRSRHSDTPR